MLEKYGYKHIKGMLLYGPPGTGKTLIARQIAKALNCHEPKIVNGPEIFNKYVGESESNIRALFKEAEEDQETLGDDSPLHIIILDEIDAICKQRGSASNSGTGVNDTVVNQLLSKIDGVNSLNNVLLIGMTNRKDMIDEAVLRPGRLELHMEIALPDEYGRKQIFEIHTRKMRRNNLIHDSVDLGLLAERTKNYTGAEIESVCRNAISIALFKGVDVSAIGSEESKKGAGPKSAKQGTGFEYRQIMMEDFEKALNETKPAFGVDEAELDTSIRGGIIPYGDRFNDLDAKCKDLVKEVVGSKKTSLISVLLEGPRGCGKTALAASIAKQSGFPYVKLISAEAFVGFSDIGKINKIVKIFEDAYKSPLSLIVLDDIERLIEFIHIGPRFSNPIL